jgi:hypothetical protein
MKMEECIENCMNCFRMCTETAIHSLNTEQAEHVVMLLDCAEICNLSAAFMMRNSERHKATCQACATICNEAAEIFEDSEDMQYQNAAAIMRKCADSCTMMANA